MQVTISEDTALEMLEARLEKTLNRWSTPNYIQLYLDMYSNYIDGGYWSNGGGFDAMQIVDNDVINYCKVITKEDYPKIYKKLLKLHNKGEYDVSCEQFPEFKISYIEAFDDVLEAFLVRIY